MSKKPAHAKATQKEIDLSFFALDIASGKDTMAERYRKYAKMKQYIGDVAQDSAQYEGACKEAARLCGI